LGEYKFTTYREACARIDAIGRGFLSLDAKPGDKILIFSETRSEWLLTAFAAFQHGLTLVTLLPTLNEDGVKHAINEAEVKIVITSQELIPKFEVKMNFQKKKYLFFFSLFRKYQIKQKQFAILFIFLLLLIHKQLKYQKIKIIFNLFH
jgi:long-subunit acyl-CoA synthetase (AMP-forming)